MRLTDIIIAGLVLGASFNVFTADKPNAATSETSARIASERVVTERTTWLRNPLLRRSTSIE